MYISFAPRFWLGTAFFLCLAGAAAADTADDVYAVAAGHYAQGRWKLAEQEFSRFVRDWPNDARVTASTLYLAEAQVQQGQHALARTGFEKFLASEPDHRLAGHAEFRIAEAAYLTGDLQTAERALRAFGRRRPEDPNNTYAFHYLGTIALREGDHRQASHWYTQAVQRFPDGPLADESRFGLARALDKQGDYQAALVAYRIVAAGQGHLADDAQLQMGISQYNRREYAGAVKAFAGTIARHPDSDLLASAWYWLGMSQIAQRDWMSAVQTLTEAAELYPEHTLTGPILFWLGEAYRQLGDRQRAQHCYRAVSNDWADCRWLDEALLAQAQLALVDGEYTEVAGIAEQFERVCPDSPLRPQLRRGLARSYLKQEAYSQALGVLQDLVSQTPAGSDEGEPEHVADVVPADRSAAERSDWYHLGLAYLGTGDYASALDALARVHPVPGEKTLQEGLWVARATGLIALERYAEAIQPLRQYLAARPSGHDASQCRIHLMVALARSGELDEALRAHSVLSESDRNQRAYLPAVNRLADVAYEAGRHAEAVSLFGIMTKQTSQPETAAQGWSGLGWSHFDAGQLDQAGEAFERLLQLYPDSGLAPEAAMMQARVLEQMNRSQDAVKVYETVSNSFTTHDHAAHALFEAARLKEQQGKVADAVGLLERIATEHADFPQMDAVLYQVGWLLRDLNRNDDADQRFQELVDQHPSSPYRFDALYRLAENAARSQQLERAERLLDRLIEAKGTPELLSHALYLKGQLAATQQRWDDVLPPMQTLLDAFPQSQLARPARYWIGEASFQQGDYDQATQSFSQLTASSTAHEDWMAMVALREAQILAAREKWRSAYDAAKVIEDRYPGFRQQYEVDYVLGRCLAMQANFDAARERYERVIRSPEGGGTETAARAQWMIGETYMHQGEHERALRAYYRVESLYGYPHWRAAALLQAGKCHALQGEASEARKLFTHVLDEHPDSPFAQEAAQRLRQLSAIEPRARGQALPIE